MDSPPRSQTGPLTLTMDQRALSATEAAQQVAATLRASRRETDDPTRRS